MDDKYFLINGGSIEAESAFQTLSKRYKIIIIDKKINNIIKKYASIYIPLSSYDFDSVITYLNKRSKLLKKIVAITNIATDNTVITAKIAKYYNFEFQSIKIAQISNDKYKQKKFFEINKIQSPKYKLIKNLKDIPLFLKKPKILKPIDGRGARGVLLYDTKRKFDYWSVLNENTKANFFLMEEYVMGIQFSLDVLVHNSNIKVFPISLRNYETTKKYYPYLIEDGGRVPFRANKELKSQIKKLIKKIVNGLNYTSGPLKFDLVYTKNKVLKIIEFATRTSGGYLSTYDLNKVTNEDFYSYYFDIFDKKEPNFNGYDDSLLFKKPKNYVLTRYLMPKEGFIENFNLPKDKNIKVFKLNLRNKMKIKNPTNHTDRLARITAHHDNLVKAHKILNKFIKNIKLDYKKKII